MKLWKGKKAGRVVAWLLASAMVLSGLTVTPVSAEEPDTVTGGDATVSGDNLGGASPAVYSIMPLDAGDGGTTYVLDANKLTLMDATAAGNRNGEKLGTDEYFTMQYYINSSKPENSSKIDTTTKSFTGFDGFEDYTATQRITLNGDITKGSIKFTTNAPATVKIYWAAGTDGSDRQIVINDENGNQKGITNINCVKNKPYCSSFDLDEKGTYLLGSTKGNNYICKVIVTETSGGIEKVKITPTITGLPSGYKVMAGSTELVSGAEAEIDKKSHALTVVKADGTEDTDYRATVDGDTTLKAGKIEDGQAVTIVVASAYTKPVVKLTDDSIALASGNSITITSDGNTETLTVGNAVTLRIDTEYELATTDGKSKATVDGEAKFTATEGMTELPVKLEDTVKTPKVIIDETEIALGSHVLTLKSFDGAESYTYKDGYFVNADGSKANLNVEVVYKVSTDDEKAIVADFDGQSTFTVTASTDSIYIILSSYQEGEYMVSVDDAAYKDGLKKGVKYAGDSVEAMCDMPIKSGVFKGSTNPKTGTSGAKGTIPDNEGSALVINPTQDGRFKVTMKASPSKDTYMVDVAPAEEGKEPVVKYQTFRAATNVTKVFNVVKGHTYYFYSNGSNMEILSFGVDYRELVDWNSLANPVAGTPIVDNEAGVIRVPYTAQVGNRYADSIDLRVIKDGSLLATVNSVDYASLAGENYIEYTPKESGVYEFEFYLNRSGETVKASNRVTSEHFTLKMADPVIVAIENQGSGSARFSWSEVPEAEWYDVWLDGEFVGTSESPVYRFTGLTVGQTYTFGVVANGNGYVSNKVEAAQTITNEAKKTWQFTSYGSSTSTKEEEDYYSEGSDSNNPVEGASVWSLNGKGKLVPNSTDGIAFYYTTMDPATENFTLTADVTVDNWTYSNGQEGFGLMAADTIGQTGDSSSIWNNSYMTTVTKVEYFWDANNMTVSDAGTKYGMYLGVGAQEKKGVTKENMEGLADGSRTAEFESTMATLDTSAIKYDTEGLGGNYNIVGNLANAMDKAVTVEERTTFHLSIQRNNTGYILSYTDENGVTTSKKYYHGDDGDELTKLDPNNIYLGFFASRNAKITVNNVSLTTIAPENDAPVEERPISYVTTKASFESATISNSQDYDLVYYGNVDGKLSIYADSGIIVEDMEVKAETKYHFPVTVYPGFVTFKAELIPDKDYAPSKYERMTDYEVQRPSIKVLYGDLGKNVVYVSPGASEYAQGTKEDPMAITKAIQFAKPGDQIIVMEGTYSLWETLLIERGINGTADAPIYMIADPEAASRPVFDFNKACAGMIFAGDYWYFQGFDVTNSADGQKGIQVSGSNNTLDDIMTYRNGNTGIQIARYKSTDLWEDWPANNLILNCTSFLNADSGYEDADGFAAKLTIADGNVFDGCIAAYNADDGWDCFAKVETGPIGKVTIKNSLAFMNGYILDEAGNLVNAGNGNGFKMGGESLTGYHTLINSVAFANKAKGIDSNSCPDIQVYNSTSYNNESYNVAFYTNNAKNTDYLADGVISYKNTNNIAEQLKPVGLQDTAKIYADNNYFFNGSKSVNTKGEAVSDDWFEVIDADTAISGFMAYINGRQRQSSLGICRNADGTINMNGFLVLTDVAPTDAGARLEGAGTASAVIKVQDLVERDIYGDDDDDDSSSSQSGAAGAQTITQPVQKPVAKKPVVAAKPATAEKPAEAEKPAATEKPAETEKPAVTEKPAETEKPAVTEDSTKNDNNAAAPTETEVETAKSSNTVPIVLGIIAVLAIVGIAVIIVLKRKDKEEQ